MGQARVYAMLALVMLFWAGNSIVRRAVHEDMPFTLAFALGGALLVLAPFAWGKVKRLARRTAALARHFGVKVCWASDHLTRSIIPALPHRSHQRS